MLMCVFRVMVSYRLGGYFPLVIFFRETEVGIQVEEGTFCCCFVPSVTAGHSENSCGLHDDNCSTSCAGLGYRISSFNCEIHAVGDLRDES